MSQRIELRIKVGNFNTKQRSQLPQMQQTREFYVNRADNNIAANILTMHRVMVKRGRYLHPVISALRLRSEVGLEVSPSSSWVCILSFNVCQYPLEYPDIETMHCALQNIHLDRSYLVPEAFLETWLRIESRTQESLRKAILFRKQLCINYLGGRFGPLCIAIFNIGVGETPKSH